MTNAPILDPGARLPPRPSRNPGTDDALRATFGTVVAYGISLLVAGMVALLAGDVSGEHQTAGNERAQLAVQSIAFILAALLLVEGLRLAYRPRSNDPLAGTLRRDPIPWVALAVVGVAAAVAASLVGPIVSAILPGLSDPATPVGELGVNSGPGTDMGTVVVVVGLIPLGEELLFRGVVAGAWFRADRPRTAIGVSAVLFSLAHVTVGPRTMVIALLLGLLFAGAMLASRSLGAAVLAHCIVNAVALLDAGLEDTAPILLLVLVIALTTAAASRLSSVVSWPPPGGTLTL